MTDIPRIYIRHIRQEKLCAGGTRDWFKRYGFDWSDFLENGISVEAFEGTGDAFAIRIAKNAREEVLGG